MARDCLGVVREYAKTHYPDTPSTVMASNLNKAGNVINKTTEGELIDFQGR